MLVSHYNHKMTTGSFRVAILLLCLFIGFETEARAYTDPGTGALIWQVLVAAFVGGMFYIRRITSFFGGLRNKSNRDK